MMTEMLLVIHQPRVFFPKTFLRIDIKLCCSVVKFLLIHLPSILELLLRLIYVPQQTLDPSQVLCCVIEI